MASDRHRFSFPEFSKIHDFETEEFNRIRCNVDHLIHIAKGNMEISCYTDSWVIDLTHIDRTKAFPEIPEKWAGTPKCRANLNSNYRSRLRVQRISSDLDNDLSHNAFKPWVQNVDDLIGLHAQFGDLRKLSIACINPGGWWPAH